MSVSVLDAPGWTQERIARALPHLTPAERRELDGLLKSQGGAVDLTNPYRTSFLAFLRDCCFTVDTARGQVRPWPVEGKWEPYWEDWEVALLRCPRLLVDKTRRTMATNCMSMFDLWVASGGVDPRWRVLTLGTDNRKVLIQSVKAEGEGGSQEFLERIGKMLKEMLDRGLRKKWPDFPEWDFAVERARASNGAVIAAVKQGADQVRGPGTLLLHAEELSVWHLAQQTIETAIPSLRGGLDVGEEDDPGLHGHLVAVCTPNNPSYARKIRMGTLDTR